MSTHGVLNEIRMERARQDQKWGAQNHPNGTGIGKLIEVSVSEAKARVERLSAMGKLTWEAILWEEVAEAFAESDPVQLRRELVQVAAVAVEWIEAIDRRAAPDHQACL